MRGGDGAGQLDQRRLGGAVGRLDHMALQGEVGDGVDDRARAAFDQQRQGLAAGDHRPAHIDAEGPVPERGVHGLHVQVAAGDLGREEGGVVVQDVKATETPRHLIDHGDDRGLVLQVQPHGQGLTADVLGYGLRPLQIEIRDRHPCAALGEQPRGRRADSAGPARHDRHASVHRKRLAHASPPAPAVAPVRALASLSRRAA